MSENRPKKPDMAYMQRLGLERPEDSACRHCGHSEVDHTEEDGGESRCPHCDCPEYAVGADLRAGRTETMVEKGDKLTCMSCGAEGVGVGFEHACDPYDARRERAAVVAYLRSVVPVPHAVRASVLTVQMLATAIERKEHLK